MNAQPIRSSAKNAEQNRTFKYEFVTGETSKVEASEEIAAFLAECDREEHAQEMAISRHTYSLDTILFEGLEYSNGETPETDLLSALEQSCISEAFSCLTETQKRRLLTLASGCSIREIARSENAAFGTVYNSISFARKKFLKKYQNFFKK